MAVLSLNDILKYIRTRGAFADKNGNVQCGHFLMTTGSYNTWLSTTGNGAIKIQSGIISLKYSDGTSMYISGNYSYYGNTLTNIASIYQERVSEVADNITLYYHNATWNNYRYISNNPTSESSRYRARIFSKIRQTESVNPSVPHRDGTPDFWRFSTYYRYKDNKTGNMIDKTKSDFALRHRGHILQFYTGTSVTGTENYGYNGNGSGIWYAIPILYNWRYTGTTGNEGAYPYKGGVYSSQNYGTGVRILRADGTMENYWRANDTEMSYAHGLPPQYTAITNEWTLYVGKLASSNHVTRITTLTNGTINDTNGGCWYYKNGHHIHVHIAVSGLSSSSTEICSMPEEYKPYTLITASAYSSTYTCGGYLSTNGKIYGWTNRPNGGALTLDFEYDAFS